MVAGAFLGHFIEYALLGGLGVTLPVWGEALWQAMVLGHFKGPNLALKRRN